MIRRTAIAASLVMHRVATIAIGASLITLVLLSGAAWRLSRGPIDLGWLTERLEAAANGNGSALQVSIGRTALVWEGFRLGVDRPLDLRLTDIGVTAKGAPKVEIPRAEVSLSLLALLHGRVQPRALELDEPRLTLRRSDSGTISIDLGDLPPAEQPETSGLQAEPLPALLALLARPPVAGDHVAPRWFSQMRRVRIHDAVVTVVDRPLGATWSAPQADVTLVRSPRGGIAGDVNLLLALGDQRVRLTGTATVSPDASETSIVARMSRVEPSALAQAAPALHMLAAVAAPVTAEATAALGPALELRTARLALRTGPGLLHVAAGDLAILGGHLGLSGTPAAFRIDDAQLRLRSPSGGPPPTLTAAGTVQQQNDQVSADLSLGFDQAAFADLASLWPPGMATDARAWVTENLTAGVAANGHVALGLVATHDLSDVTLTRLSGALDGRDLTVWWLRPVPPIIDGQAVLRFVDPDTVQIDVSAGHQTLKDNAGLTITGGSMRISGLMQRHQVGQINAQIAGPLADTIALLREPRLQLLAEHPVLINNPAGDVTATVATTVPLEKTVRIDDIAIRVDAHIANAFLGGVVAGHDLADGALDLSATNNGLNVNGTARLAGIPAKLGAAMDFRAGPPDQVLQRFTASGRADAKQLAKLGLDATDVLSGPVGLHVVLTEQRDEASGLEISADLTDAALAIAPLDWRKPAGVSAEAGAVLRLTHDRLERIEQIRASGAGFSLRGSATCADGRVAQVRLDALTLGRSQMHGTISLPSSPRAGPIAVRVNGPVLDLAARLEAPKPKASRLRGPPHEPPPGPPWSLDASFERVLMAHNYLVAPLTVHIEDDGRVYRRLDIAGATRADGTFSVKIAPVGGERRLTVTAARTGDLLRALDVTGSLQEGSLAIAGTYDDSTPAHELRGTAELNDFRMSRAAALGKLLQAMTLYGLVDALRGPGLRFSRLVAPFTLSDGMLRLTDARAFSPSLGLTAKGWIDLDANTTDLQGTIVPAYFFNSLLGNVPLVGRLFSPERGGGVFAASYGLRGDLDDPNVSVNPLTALTPGFLRGLFGLL